jgi:membrane-associated phospholipid phosphatase
MRSLVAATTAFDSRLDDRLSGIYGRPLVRRGAWLASRVGDAGVATMLVFWAVRGDGRDRTRAVALAANAAVVNLALKRAFDRPRPLGGGHTSSFPSGHAATVTALAMAHPSARAIWGAGAGLVAAGRLGRRAHWGSDVVAGVFAGAAVGSVLRRVLAR